MVAIGWLSPFPLFSQSGIPSHRMVPPTFEVTLLSQFIFLDMFSQTEPKWKLTNTLIGSSNFSPNKQA